MKGMLLGADPEFVFQKSGSVFVPANSVLRGGDFGYDGHAATGELRPEAAPSALKLTANIRALLTDGWKNEILQDLEMLAGHYKHRNTIGGHIHISGFEMDMPVLSAHLDVVLGRLSDCIDHLDERKTRRGAGYGSGYRSQNENWIEYRAPGSWLLSPQVTFIHLWLAEAVSQTYASGKAELIQVVKKHEACEGIMQFAVLMTDVPDQEIFLKVADKVFSQLPLNWNEDMKANWS